MKRIIICIIIIAITVFFMGFATGVFFGAGDVQAPVVTKGVDNPRNDFMWQNNGV